MTASLIEGWDILDQAAELSRRGQEFALATVVWRQGPSSGQQGSRAIVTTAGQIYGWIGGACAEPVVIREAQQVITDRRAKLVLLGTPEQFGDGVPDGMSVVPISCQSEGALEVFIEPVIPTLRLVIVGRSPMAQTLAELSAALGWRSELHSPGEFSAADLDARSVVVVATQGHGDEEAIAAAVTAFPAFVGLVASRKRGKAVLGYLAERGIATNLLDRVKVPVGLDLGHTSHREIAVAILAELVALRAAGALAPEPAGDRPPRPATELDPVCGMSVVAEAANRPLEHSGSTYYFCCVGCRDAFAAEPGRYLSAAAPTEEFMPEPSVDHDHDHGHGHGHGHDHGGRIALSVREA